MPAFEVRAPGGVYPVVVERDALSRWREYVPPSAGAVFVITEKSVWRLHGARLGGVADGDVLFLPGGEENKRIAPVEVLAEELVKRGADRTSVVLALGGGITTDMAGFLAAIFLRGVALIQAPTTLLAQVDAAIGGKTGVNLAVGKNLLGSFHQPKAVLIDPEVLSTLPEREFRSGLFEVIKHGVIASPDLFAFLRERRAVILSREPEALEYIIGESVRIKAEVVSADERESGLRRILNFGHTIGHAIEAETCYRRFLHGEAVALGMRGATHLARLTGMLPAADAIEILRVIDDYGPAPAADGISPEAVFHRLAGDKKTVRGSVHFVLPVRIGQVEVTTGISRGHVLSAVEQALA